MEAAHTYLVVSGISFVFLGMYNTGAAILRCQEDTKTSMSVSLVMNIVNVVFNAWFVFGLHMGVLGVAVATLISRAALFFNSGIAGMAVKFYTSECTKRRRRCEVYYACQYFIHVDMQDCDKLCTCDVVSFRNTRSLAWNVCGLVCQRHQLFLAVSFKEMYYEKVDITILNCLIAWITKTGYA